MLLFHWLEAPFDWVDRRRVTGPANAQRMIAPPKEAVSMPDGTLELRSCEYLWDELSTQTVTPSLAVALDGVYDGDWEFRAGALHGFSATGMGVAVLPGSSADFVLETTITLEDAREAGLFFRGEEDANVGTFVSLVPSRQRAELHRVLTGSPYEPRRLGRGIVVLQETHLPLERHKPVRVRVVAWGPYVEVSFDGRVMLCFMTMSRRRGRIGFFVNDGHASFADAKLQILKRPPMPEAQE
jgi:hypothetical protein